MVDKCGAGDLHPGPRSLDHGKAWVGQLIAKGSPAQAPPMRAHPTAYLAESAFPGQDGQNLKTSLQIVSMFFCKHRKAADQGRIRPRVFSLGRVKDKCEDTQHSQQPSRQSLPLGEQLP